jgi:Fe-S cluster assembly protein SufD
MTVININKTTALFLDQLVAHTNFTHLRTKGLDLLKEKGLPVLKEEEYKFTPISKKLEQSIVNFATAQKIQLSEEIIKTHIFEGFEGDIIVFNNGVFDASVSSVSQNGYTLETLSGSQPELLGQIAKTEKDPFVALNNVFFEDGIYLKVGKNQKVDQPVLFLYFNQANKGEAITPRLLIEIEAGAEVKFLENTISLDEEAYFSNPVTEIKVGKNANVHYSRFQKENRKSISVNNFEVDILKDATFTSVLISLEGDMLRNNLSLNLLDSGCEGNMYGLYLLNGKTHVDNHTNVDHIKPHCQSNELYKGVLADSSRGVFNGKIFVRQDAQKTNAFQQNNNILLSENAIVNTKPQLEIWADDVKCSHGCTTGQLDEEALFYLQARGIGKENARGLLLYAFAGEVLEHITVEPFKEYCLGLVQERLGSNF